VKAGDPCPDDMVDDPCPGVLVESSLSQYHICTHCRLWVRKTKPNPREGL
jgi:hypothetical protein